MDGAVERLSDVPVLVRESWDPVACPPSLLPWLASAFSVDTWDTDWTEDQKRQTILDSVFVHRKKGTIGAVKRALASVGFGVQVQEWFNQVPAGEPFTFRLLLEADQVGIDEAALAKIMQVVNATKNLRSHLDKIVPQVKTRTGPVVAGAAGVGHEVVVGYGAPDLYLLTEGASSGMAETGAAVDALHATIHTTMTTANYW